jgi:hypothetical protein
MAARDLGVVEHHVRGIAPNHRFGQGRVGVPYRVTDDGVVFGGDRGLQEVTVLPALDVLGDDRLAGARAEFEDAVAKLRAGGAKT